MQQEGDSQTDVCKDSEMRDQDECLTISVPEAGRRYLGLKRDASYRAAKRGDIPVIRVGRLLRVSKRAMERRLDAFDTLKLINDASGQ
jgi:excisionase family DNA binding protein